MTIIPCGGSVRHTFRLWTRYQIGCLKRAKTRDLMSCSTYVLVSFSRIVRHHEQIVSQRECLKKYLCSPPERAQTETVVVSRFSTALSIVLMYASTLTNSTKMNSSSEHAFQHWTTHCLWRSPRLHRQCLQGRLVCF